MPSRGVLVLLNFLLVGCLPSSFLSEKGASAVSHMVYRSSVGWRHLIEKKAACDFKSNKSLASVNRMNITCLAIVKNADGCHWIMLR